MKISSNADTALETMKKKRDLKEILVLLLLPVTASSKGIGGKGGDGGSAAFDGFIYIIRYEDGCALFGAWTFEGPTLEDFKFGNFYGKAKNGVAGQNKVGIEELDSAEFENPSYSVNSYKSYLRENLADNFQESRIRKFMLALEADESIRSLYNTMSFVDELKSLENKYLLLRNKIPFFPFCESLKDRIGEFQNSSNVTGDYKKILKFVLTSVLGKISHLRNKENLRNFKNQISVVDLSGYLEMVQKNIRKMNDIKHELSVAQQTEEYQKSLMDKINSAIDMANNEIIPAISDLFGPLADEIMALIAEVLQNRREAVAEQERLTKEMLNEQKYGGIKTLAAMAPFFGLLAKAIGTFIELGADIAESTEKYMQHLAKLSEGFQKHTDDMKEFLKEPILLYSEQLKYMDDVLADVKSTHNIELYLSYEDVQNTIKEYIEELKGYLQPNSSFYDYGRIVAMRQNLDKQIKAIKIFKNPAILLIETVNNMANMALDMWNKVKDSKQHLNELYNQQKEVEDKFNKWDAILERIRNVLLPMMIQVELTIIEISNSLADKNLFQLDITAWKVKSSLSQLKLVVLEVAEDTSHENQLNHIIVNIEEAFGTLIDIYDRIQSFMDQSKFAGFLSGINSPNDQNIENDALKNVVTELKRNLQSNIVLEQYDVAIHSFKEHFFPFAALHLVNFDLPTGLQVSDTKALANEAGEQINYLQGEVKFLDVSFGRFDREIFGDISFYSNSIAQPFYIFSSREFKDLFRKLMTGEEITIKANIARGLSQNAIKFNEIGIQLKLIDEQMQEEFDAVLESFGVRMTLVGHTYYKCAEKFYYLPVDENVVIEYSFKMNTKGKPMKYNEVYRKLSESHYFLSPYTTWKIKLINDEDFHLKTGETGSENGYEKLRKFANSAFNMELVGRGQYFRSNGILEAEVCNDVVEKYYELDNSLNDVPTYRRLKKKYLLK